MRIKSIKTVAVTMLLGLAASSAPAAGTFYTDESLFLTAINPVFYLEDFNGFTDGSPLGGPPDFTYDAPGANGYDWTAFSPGGLYANPGALSVFLGNTSLTIGFTGAPVTAFGGLFSDTTVDFQFQAGMVTIVTTDGGTLTIPTTTDAFVGYVTTTPIVSVTFTANSDALADYIQIDHFYTGSAALVPEPSTLACLFLGLGTTASFTWFRNKRRR
jgi:hypothetical protein